MLFSGEVQKGNGHATQLGFPTLNIVLTDPSLDGIFVARAWIQGHCYTAALFADQRRHVLEIHCVDEVPPTSTTTIEVYPLEKIRETEYFSDTHSLRVAIADDVRTVRVYVESHPLQVMLFGTFDGVHEGHRNMFQQARALSKVTELTVSIARDEVVKRIKKTAPHRTETQRYADVSREREVDVVVLGELGDHVPHIVKVNPDVIALGYDQEGEYVASLETKLREAGLTTRIVRLAPFRPEVYKSSMLAQKSFKYMGIDYGARHIGLALSDSEGRIAFPLDIITTTENAVEEILARAQKEGVGRIVIGDTRTLEGFSNTVTARADDFIQNLISRSSLPVERVGEAFATNEALRFAPRGKKHDDSAAAAIILQRYLDSKVMKPELE